MTYFKTCQDCGIEFEAHAHNAKHCPTCRHKLSQQYQREYHRRNPNYTPRTADTWWCAPRHCPYWRDCLIDVWAGLRLPCQSKSEKDRVNLRAEFTLTVERTNGL